MIWERYAQEWSGKGAWISKTFSWTIPMYRAANTSQNGRNLWSERTESKSESAMSILGKEAVGIDRSTAKIELERCSVSSHSDRMFGH